MWLQITQLPLSAKRCKNICRNLKAVGPNKYLDVFTYSKLIIGDGVGGCVWLLCIPESSCGVWLMS